MRKDCIKTLVLAVALSAGVCGNVMAHDFALELKNGNTLFFNVTDSVKHTAEVTYEGSIAQIHRHLPAGILEIPGIVKNEGKVYMVTSVRDKAFSGADKLQEVVFPASVQKIGAFAFENCKSLTMVSFPMTQPEMGEGAFFNCDKIESIAFGKEWTTIDMGCFAWSNFLKSVSVPASVTQIKNLKSLRVLENIEIDRNNAKFKSIDGLLYSKDGKVLYACPKGRSGDVTVADGTESVLDGALIDCYGLESVTLPATLRKLSFLEFSENVNLKSVTIMSENPVVTAVRDGSEVFALVMASGETTLYVPKHSYKSYCEQLVSDTGYYTAIDSKKSGKYYAESFIKKNNIKKIK